MFVRRERTRMRAARSENRRRNRRERSRKSQPELRRDSNGNISVWMSNGVQKVREVSPRDIHNSAEIDGAGEPRVFSRIFPRALIEF